MFGLEFPINPERVAPVLRGLITPTHTRARIYDRDGTLILDSRNLYGRGDVLRFDLPPPNDEKPGLFERAYIGLRKWLSRGDLPPYRERSREAKGLSGDLALNGRGAIVSMNNRGDHRLGGGPGQALLAVRGAPVASTQARHQIIERSAGVF